MVKKPKRSRLKLPLAAAPYETFANALGKPIDSAETRLVIDALGGIYEVRPWKGAVSRYDPDAARTVSWEFTSAPPTAWGGAAKLSVRDDTVVSMALSPDLVEGAISNQVVFFSVPNEDVEIFRPRGSDWNWAPAITQRGTTFLLDLDVAQGHWDGNYKFPLTPRQAESLRAEPLLYREVWDGLVRICQSRRFFDDPQTLPGDAQSLINARCGRDAR